MVTKRVKEAPAVEQVRDHRVEIAEKKRILMRLRLVDATMRVYAHHQNGQPVIDDVIREAKVSRGTFYNYFDSLDDVLAVISQDLSNQMAAEMLSVYDVLNEPWQRFSIGFRIFLTRAVVDQKWAGFIIRADAWAKDTLVDKYMSGDLKAGHAAGQFQIDDVGVAADFLKGASSHGIQSLRRGVADPMRYIDAAVRMAFVSVGCSRALCDRGVAFSAEYMRDWISGKLGIARPHWVLNMSTRELTLLLGNQGETATPKTKVRKRSA